MLQCILSTGARVIYLKRNQILSLLASKFFSDFPCPSEDWILSELSLLCWILLIFPSLIYYCALSLVLSSFAHIHSQGDCIYFILNILTCSNLFLHPQLLLWTSDMYIQLLLDILLGCVIDISDRTLDFHLYSLSKLLLPWSFLCQWLALFYTITWAKTLGIFLDYSPSHLTDNSIVLLILPSKYNHHLPSSQNQPFLVWITAVAS